MSKEIKKFLESDLCDLVLKYSKIRSAGEITDLIIRQMVCNCCAASMRTGEFETIEQDLFEIVSDNVNRARIYRIRNNE